MKVFISGNVPQIAIEILKKENIEIEQWLEEKIIPYDTYIQKCQQADALINVGASFKLDDSFLTQVKNLKIISLFSVGYDHIDVSSATHNHIPVANIQGIPTDPTADTAFLLMQMVARKAYHLGKKVEKGEWSTRFDPTTNLGIELQNKTIGIFGLGHIGMQMAQRCVDAFGMSLIYHNRNRNYIAEEKLNAKYVSFDELLEQSDVLSVHSILSKQNFEIFNEIAFAKMKKTAIFINTARGKIHNEIDLTKALQNNTIWGAGLDVTNPEPMNPDNVLLQLENVCVLPHIGSATIEHRNKMAEICVQNVLQALKGEKIKNIINSDLYQKV